MLGNAAVASSDGATAMRGALGSLSRVLVACDFSPGAERALKRAVRLPLAKGATVEIMHALPPAVPTRARTGMEAQAREALEHAARRTRQAAAAAGRELVVNTELVAGQAFKQIVRRSQAIDAELVLVSGHEHRPLRDFFVTSTPQRVVRNGDAAVLVVRLEPSRPYVRPLLATDLDDGARLTVDLALRLLTADASSVTVLHAFRSPYLGFASASFSDGERREYRRLFKHEARARLNQLLSGWADGRPHFRPVVCEGTPGPVILNQARRRDTDLIVLGTHSRSRVAHTLLGWVPEWVLARAPCDVLLRRPERRTLEPSK